MTPPPTELLKGTLDLLILRTLDLQPMHGVAIAERIHQLTRGTFQVKPGSLFPALHRLEQEGWITGQWQESAAGRRQLATEKAAWRRIVGAMSQVLDPAT